MVDSVIKISDDLDTIERLQHHMHLREKAHRDTSEALYWRLNILSIAKYSVLGVVAFVQLFYIRSWFSGAKENRV